MARAIASRILHEPTLRLKRSGERRRRLPAGAALRELFGLDPASEPLEGARREVRRLRRAPPRPPVEGRLRIGTRGERAGAGPGRGVATALWAAPSSCRSRTSTARSGDKARFVREVERALLDGEVDLAVHSAKDLPGELPDGLALVGVPGREDPADAFVGEAGSLDEVPEGARVGTASLRRRSQLLALRPDLEVVELRGNVDTRLRKLAEGEADGIVLAAAGLRRLGRDGARSRSASAPTR